MNETEYESYFELLNEAHDYGIERDERLAEEYSDECYEMMLEGIID